MLFTRERVTVISFEHSVSMIRFHSRRTDTRTVWTCTCEFVVYHILGKSTANQTEHNTNNIRWWETTAFTIIKTCADDSWDIETCRWKKHHRDNLTPSHAPNIVLTRNLAIIFPGWCFNSAFSSWTDLVCYMILYRRDIWLLAEYVYTSSPHCPLTVVYTYVMILPYTVHKPWCILMWWYYLTLSINRGVYLCDDMTLHCTQTVVYTYVMILPYTVHKPWCVLMWWYYLTSYINRGVNLCDDITLHCT